MVNETQLLETIKVAKKSEKERKFKQSLEMIMVFRDIDVKKGFAINEVIQLPNQIYLMIYIKYLSYCNFP